MIRPCAIAASGLAVAVLLASAHTPCSGAGAPLRPNVLLLIVDDLRPELGCYGAVGAISPNIDRFAAGGLRFDRAYCQQAICMASRASFLSGLRPDAGRIFEEGPLFRHVPDALPVNQHFLDHGYEAVSIGKVYHHRSDYRTGWSTPPFFPEGDWEGRGYLNADSIAEVRRTKRGGGPDERLGPAYESADVPDGAYPDGVIAARAVAELNRLQRQPFFLAVGFLKPHLPFNAPAKYWAMHPAESIELPPGRPPVGVPACATMDSGEARRYGKFPDRGPIPRETAVELVRGYRACVTYTDAMIGRVLDELDRLGLADDTVVLLWGDHGWKLGDLGMWGKHSAFERDNRVPLVIRTPTQAPTAPSTAALVELVDLYPTLCELCGLPTPAHAVGRSVAPLIGDPSKPWKKGAFSQYPRGNRMGYSVRTDRFRYTEWRDRAGRTVARELYDLGTGLDEGVNLAGSPTHAGTAAKHAELLNRAGLGATWPERRSHAGTSPTAPGTDGIGDRWQRGPMATGTGGNGDRRPIASPAG